MTFNYSNTKFLASLHLKLYTYIHKFVHVIKQRDFDGSSKAAAAIKYNTVPSQINKRIKMYDKNVYNCHKK